MSVLTALWKMMSSTGIPMRSGGCGKKMLWSHRKNLSLVGSATQQCETGKMPLRPPGNRPSTKKIMFLSKTHQMLHLWHMITGRLVILLPSLASIHESDAHVGYYDAHFVMKPIRHLFRGNQLCVKSPHIISLRYLRNRYCDSFSCVSEPFKKEGSARAASEERGRRIPAATSPHPLYRTYGAIGCAICSMCARKVMYLPCWGKAVSSTATSVSATACARGLPLGDYDGMASPSNVRQRAFLTPIMRLAFRTVYCWELGHGVDQACLQPGARLRR